MNDKPETNKIILILLVISLILNLTLSVMIFSTRTQINDRLDSLSAELEYHTHVITGMNSNIHALPDDLSEQLQTALVELTDNKYNPLCAKELRITRLDPVKNEADVTLTCVPRFETDLSDVCFFALDQNGKTYETNMGVLEDNTLKITLLLPVKDQTYSYYLTTSGENMELITTCLAKDEDVEACSLKDAANLNKLKTEGLDCFSTEYQELEPDFIFTGIFNTYLYPEARFRITCDLCIDGKVVETLDIPVSKPDGDDWQYGSVEFSRLDKNSIKDKKVTMICHVCDDLGRKIDLTTDYSYMYSDGEMTEYFE